MTAGEPVLTVRDLRAWYGESQVLFGTSLDVREGETVTLRGRDLLALPVHRVAHTGLGYVPEERGIFASLSVEENLALPPRVADGGLPVEQIYAMFPNLQERRRSPGGKLSGGEQQMLAIARVLRTGARVLLLDEPTEGLAPVIVQRIGELLRQLKDLGYTVLLVEQNFRFAARLAERFFVMENGRVIDVLSAPELKTRADALHAYLGV